MIKRIIIVAACAIFATVGAHAGALDEAREAQLDGRYAAAADILRRAAAADPKGADEYLYLLASNLYIQNKPSEAVAAADRVISEFPTSPWYYKALFKKADSLALTGKLDEAEKIYETQTERILSVDRKEHIAKIYVEYADRFYEPTDKDQAPDYGKAVQFYRKALDAGLPEEKTFYARLHAALALYKDGNPYDANSELSVLLAAKNLPDEYRAPALYNQGLAYQATNDMRNARKSFKTLLDEFPGDEAAPEAAFKIGTTYNLPNPYSDRELELGVQAMKDFIEKFSTSEKAPEASFTIAMTYYNRGRYEDAIEQLKNLVDMFGGKENVDQAPRAKMLIGECYYSQEKYVEAIAAWEKFAREHPVHQDWNKSQRRILDAEFAIAQKLATDKKYDEARTAFNVFIEKHPIDERARQAMYMLGNIEYQLENFKGAVELWRPLASKHPGSDPASHAQFQIGEIYDEKFDDQEQAIKEFEAVTGSYRSQAQQRIAAMKQPEITVVTEKSFTTGEKPVLKLSMRNVEKVTARAYRINMEEYFNKYHGIRGVENLDIALIDPDISWEYAVDNYRQYKRYETDLAAPIKGAGAYAVTIGTDDMEVTTLLLVTDIALITKASRDAAFIYAQNMKTGEPAPGVKILMYNGGPTFEAGKTGRDGVLQYAKKETESPYSNLSVLGVLGDSVTSNSFYSGTYASSNPGKSRGLIYTDRPAYRPGQDINAKGIFRLVKSGGYDFKAGAPYKAEVRSGNGTLVCEREGALSEFGTFDLTCPTGERAAPGTWSVKATIDKEQAVTASFQVKEYKLDRMKLDISLEKDVFMRGDVMKGTIKASYYFGAPVEGKTVTWTISGGYESESGSGVTDENGEVKFEFNTADLDESATISVSAGIPDENLYTNQTAWVTVTEFDMSVSTLRSFYLSGEPFEVTVKTADVKGRPASAQVRLEVLRQVSSGSGTSEVKVQDIDMTESAKGVSRAQVTLDKSGYYTLRAFSKDSFGNVISSSASIYISGDDDSVKIRIIADRDEFLVGESPSVRLVYRESAAPALVTLEGEGIYSYRIIKLARGDNSLKLDIKPELAPNFILSVSVMTGGKFYTADKSFDALQGLKISIVPEKDVYAPGEKMKLKIKTTDQYGTPVRAELSLAMVDEALFAQYSDNTPRLGEFFFGTKRFGSFNTDSTYPFSYEGVLKRIAKDIVAEMTAEKERYEDRMDDSVSRKKMAYKSEAKMARPAAPAAEMMLMSGEGNGAIGLMDMDEEYAADEPAPSGYKGGAMYDRAPAPVARLREFFPETGFWTPSVVTGADGSAELTVPLPDNATSWRITSRGITKDTMVGEQTTSIVTKEKLFITVKAPTTVVEGSLAGLTAEIHNTTDKELSVTMNFSIGENGEKESRKITVAAGSAVEEIFTAEAKNAGTLSIYVEALSSEFSDKMKQDITVTPFGKMVAEVKSGVSSESSVAEISLPQNLKVKDRALTIRVSPSLKKSVLDVTFPATYSNDDAALKAISILYRLEYLGSGSGDPDYSALAGELPVLLSQIASSMDRNGLKRWSGSGASNSTGTCHAVWALSMASRMGFSISTSALNTGMQNLEERFSKSSSNDEKAEILHALSMENRADAAYLNRLDREKASLSPRGLAFLALAFDNMDRGEYAQSAAQQLEASLDSIITPMTRKSIKDYPDVAIYPPYENSLRALALLAIESATPNSPAVDRLKTEVEASRWGNCWSGAETTSYSVAALSSYYSSASFSSDRYSLDVKVNGKTLQTIQANDSHPAVDITVPEAADSNKIEFAMNGRGTYSWSAVMTGFTSDMSYREDMKLENTRVGGGAFEMSPPVINGKTFEPGSSVTENYPSTPSNKTMEVKVGDYVKTGFSTFTDSNKPKPGFTVVEFPIPGGLSLEKETVRGNYEYMEQRDGYAAFYCSGGCEATLRLYGNIEGSYKINPIVFYSQSAPENKFYYNSGGSSFKVVSGGGNHDTKYELSADQLYYYGKDLFDSGLREDARPMLEKLIAAYKLRDEYFKEVHKMLMYSCIDRDDSRCIVEHFEVLKEKYPTLSLEFEDVLRVGKAYADMKENERAIQVFQTALEASFMKDGEARIFLEDMGELRASVSFLKDLTREYPDMNITKNAAYSAGHALFSVATTAGNDSAAREKKMDRDTLLTEAAKAYNEFMLYHPDSAYVDEAGFSLMSSVFEFGDNDEVISLASKFRKRFPKSSLLDSYEYLEAYANFEAGNFDRALKLCAGISEGEYYGKNGKLAKSDNINEAQYLSGQIYHAMNEPDKAAEYYEKVAGKFADAGLALEYFNRKVFSVPQVVTSPSDSGATLPLTHRNIDSAHVKVYKIDLMKYYLLRKSLAGMSDIQLSGVKPAYEKTITLSSGREYRDRVTNLSIPLREDGAYLVELRAGGDYRSTILLRTNLEMEVQEDASAGLVRVNVLDARTKRYVSAASVKVVGSKDGKIQSGSTDLRGIFTAESVYGTAAVLCRKNDQYAFYSGETQMSGGRAVKGMKIDADMMRNVNTQNILLDNAMIQRKSADYLRNNFTQQESGVQIQQIQQQMMIMPNQAPEMQIQMQR